MALIDPAIDIALASVVVVAASRLLQSRLIDKEKQKAAQQRMKEKQARIKLLIKNNDEKSRNEMQKLQQEMLEEMNETMQGSMRYMMLSLPLFFGVYMAFGFFYGGMTLQAPFPVPRFANFFIFNPFTWVPAGWGPETGWLKWYFITYLIISVALGIVLKAREMASGKRK